MENDEKLLIQLRDCFTAGYTLPQYCIDNKIKYPLFISEKKFSHFMWEVYVQFLYDKRMMPAFSFLDMPDDKINFWYNSYFLPPLTFKNISNVDVSKYSKVFFITLNKIDVKPVSAIYLDELTSFFNNYVYVEIPMLHFLRYHPKVKVFFTNIPSYIGKYPGGMELNKTLIDTYMLGKQLRNAEGNNLKTPLDKFGYTNKEVYELIFPTNKGTIANLDGFTTLKDNDHPLIRIKNGRRMTAYQPEHYKNKIYFIGPCYYLGSYAPFDKTIESYLQKILNESDLPYCVENEGQDYAGRCYDTFYNLYNLDCKAGDIIFVWLQSNLSNIIPSLDLSDAFDSPHDYKEIFVDKHHINELGYKILAERFFKFLTENNFFRDKEFNYPLPPPPYHRYGIPSQFEQGGVKSEIVNEELEAYKEQLKAKKPQIGALVMNCNPFTLGHQYLVEYAAAKVDKLYVFVVEEDKSEFPFADRIELVRQGVNHIPNVEVLPSGKFIISQTTFSGYFSKASLQDVQVDSSEDVEIFGREIAPTLGITVRFAGEEPTDNVTRQYNETMKEILPRYGVEFCEIPRKEFDGEPISASKVRAALKVGDFNKIKKLVPKSTLQYLRKRTGQEVKEEPIVSDMAYQDLRSFIW